jgi:hypothetical protein
LTQGKSPAKKQAAFLETPSKMQPRPRQQVVAAANAMQKVLFAHQSIGRILQWSKQSQQDDPPTFFTQFSRVATNIIETGQIAQTSEDIHEADFLVFDGLEYESWLMFGSGDKIVLLQDGKILQMRPPMSLSVVLTKLKQQSRGREMFVDVQDMNQVHGGRQARCAAPMSIQEALTIGVERSIKMPYQHAEPLR